MGIFPVTQRKSIIRVLYNSNVPQKPNSNNVIKIHHVYKRLKTEKKFGIPDWHAMEL